MSFCLAGFDFQHTWVVHQLIPNTAHDISGDLAWLGFMRTYSNLKMLVSNARTLTQPTLHHFIYDLLYTRFQICITGTYGELWIFGHFVWR